MIKYFVILGSATDGLAYPLREGPDDSRLKFFGTLSAATYAAEKHPLGRVHGYRAMALNDPGVDKAVL